MDELRVRLIERLCRLPQRHLTAVDNFLSTLDRNTEEQVVRRFTPSDVPSPPAMPITPHEDWPHAPIHRLSEHGTFIVTASTLHKAHLFRGVEKLTMLEDQLLRIARQHEVALEAWAVFSNHYHFVAHTSGAENQLKTMITRLHYVTAEAVKHGLVRRANEYRWCSAAWFERLATPAQLKMIYGFRTDRIRIDDDYEPII